MAKKMLMDRAKTFHNMTAQSLQALTVATSPQTRDEPKREILLLVPGSADSSLAESALHPLESLAAGFGWSARVAVGVDHPGCDPARIAAVLFRREALGTQCSWSDALGLLAERFPEARLIPCLGFSEPADLNHLADAGAFHFLWLPLRESELRQCLGFVWQTRCSRAARAVPTPIRKYSAA